MYKNERMRIYFLPLSQCTVLSDDLIKPENKTEGSERTEKIPVWSVYIEHPDARIIFDTGERHPSDRGILENRLLQQLTLCGVEPEEIDYIIMSHLHNDHAGNMNLFPNARVIVQRQEFEDAMEAVQHGNPIGIYHREDLDIEVKWMLVEGRYHLLDGIELIPFPGHTKGLQGMLLSLDHTGKILLTSDACYTSIHFGPPFRLAGVCVCESDALESLKVIKETAEKEKAKIIFGHDMRQFQQLKKAPEFYD